MLCVLRKTELIEWNIETHTQNPNGSAHCSANNEILHYRYDSRSWVSGVVNRHLIAPNSPVLVTRQTEQSGHIQSRSCDVNPSRLDTTESERICQRDGQLPAPPIPPPTTEPLEGMQCNDVTESRQLLTKNLALKHLITQLSSTINFISKRFPFQFPSYLLLKAKSK